MFSYYHKYYVEKNGKKYGPYYDLMKSVRKGKKVCGKFLKYIGKDIPLDRETISEKFQDPGSDIFRAASLFRSGEAFIVLDEETTGFAVTSYDRIFEIALEVYYFDKNGRTVPVDMFHEYVNPRRSIPAEIVELTHVDPAIPGAAPPISHFIREIHNAVIDFPIVGHNIGFDLRALNTEFERAGLSPYDTSNLIDTAKISRAMWERRKHKHRLIDCADRLRVDEFEREEYHNALHDVRANAVVFEYMLRKLATTPEYKASFKPIPPQRGG